MKIRRVQGSLLLAAGLWMLSTTSFAAEPHHAPMHKGASDVTWVYPVIPKFGGVHPNPGADMQPDPNADYKILVDVVTGDPSSGHQLGSLNRLARLVNLMGYAKVPQDHVHIVAVLDRQVGATALTNAAYRKFFDKKGKGENPNLPILRALKKAGVKLMICSQAMAEMGLKNSDIDPSVTVTLSALTDPVIYGHRGYTYMQL
ncbi:DsrE family protein [Oleiagrimonas soli]|uniref:Intracellular sulfur oxidation DsrE/DsrF family protein n=1 Tax=Oleiagrimonas soli TaxID=1543381 RepID=A0A099CXM5_9GAMM|nr:DsrE family protein [Oleiagrimonas soli]KGI78367.1 hypothetical protein LF63_0105170 [Oleiagrimonas soli]MBB6183852.1 intracellular sulfur oxidation DsrE/DsrF family protein [Oleiagrimonas soli]